MPKTRAVPTLSAMQARRAFAETLNRVAVGKERIVLTRRGRPVAALVPVEDLRLYERLLEEYEDRLDVQAARAALAESDERIPYEKIRRELGLA